MKDHMKFDLFDLNQMGPDGHKCISNKSSMFIRELEYEFGDRIDFLVEQRKKETRGPRFLNRTKHIRYEEWKCSEIPKEVRKRKVEITGPPDRKMIINALNSGADVYMADFEDSCSPTAENLLTGQDNLMDAVDGTISFTDSVKGKHYSLNDKTAVLMVRPRGLHMVESKVSKCDGYLAHASLFDFGLFFINNVEKLIVKGSRPYIYLPKIEHWYEARLWADIFTFAENYVGLDHGTIKATVLIETLPAIFQANEILYYLKDYIIGLNCGRWDYIFSFIKTMKNDSRYVLPDRSVLSMDKEFLDSYSKYLVDTCHRRGVYAMGGMSAFVPVGNSENKEKALEQVRIDKQRELANGHDGTWVAHPGLVELARQEMKFEVNQIGNKNVESNHKMRENGVAVNLLTVPSGDITDKGIASNIAVSLEYMAHWLNGNGCVAINSLMEDMATAEISRSQLWQWLKHKKMTREQFEYAIEVECAKLSPKLTDTGVGQDKLKLAKDILVDITTREEMADFLSLEMYKSL